MSSTTNVPGVCVIVREENQCLFVFRFATGFNDNFYAVPGGHVDDGETFKEAACRELEEETGLLAKPEDLEYKLTVHRKTSDDIRVDVWFVAKEWAGVPKNYEPKKHSRIEWLDWDDLPENIVDYMKYGIENIKKGNTYGEFGF